MVSQNRWTRALVLFAVIWLILGTPCIASAEEPAKDPRTAAEWLHQGLMEKFRMNTAKAIAAFTRAIELEPGLAAGYRYRGLAYYEAGKFEAAIADFGKLIELKPGVESYSFRADSCFKLENYRAAIADYTKAIELEPRNTALYYRRALCFRALSDYAGALADIEQAFRITPDAEHRRERALARMDTGAYAQAIEDFDLCIAENPEDYVSLNFRAEVNGLLGRNAEAEAGFEAAMRIAPDNFMPYLSRGNFYGRSGDYVRALADTRRSLELKETATGWFNLAQIFEKLGDRERALKAYGMMEKIGWAHIAPREKAKLKARLSGDWLSHTDWY